MKTSYATSKMANYIKEQNLSVDQIACETNISKEKLVLGGKHVLEAGEFLELCSYLKIKPEFFYNPNTYRD